MAKPSRKRRRRNKQDFRIDLTSMMSLFSILIVFMLKSFSTQPDIINASDQLRLPESTSLISPKPALKMTLTTNDLLLDDKIVVDIKSIRNQKDLLIEALSAALEFHKKKTDLISQTNKKIKFEGEILLQSDKEIDFAVVKKVMFTSGQAGFETIHMVVIAKEL